MGLPPDDSGAAPPDGPILAIPKGGGWVTSASPRGLMPLRPGCFEELRRQFQEQSEACQQLYVQALAQLERANQEHIILLRERQVSVVPATKAQDGPEPPSLNVPEEPLDNPVPLVSTAAVSRESRKSTGVRNEERRSSRNKTRSQTNSQQDPRRADAADPERTGTAEKVPATLPDGGERPYSSEGSLRNGDTSGTLQRQEGAGSAGDGGTPKRDATPKGSLQYAMPHAVRSKSDGHDSSTGVQSLRVIRMMRSSRRRFEQWRSGILKRPPTPLGRLADSVPFKILTTLAILLNAMSLGAEKQHQLNDMFKHPDPKGEVRLQSEDFWRTVELFWCVFFALELVFRAAAERAAFVVGKRWQWNAFDSVLVVTSIWGLILAGTRTPDIQFARVLRMLRFTRVLRVLRAMRFSQSLRLMVFSILASLFSLLWVMAIMLFVIYFFSVFFLSGVIEQYQAGDLTGDAIEKVKTFYGSMGQTILSLFLCVSGGADWNDVMEPLYSIGQPHLIGGFVFYIIFMAFGVLNVVTGHFVDSATQVAARDREAVVKNEMKQEREYVAQMRAIFREADKDTNGTLSWEEFEEHLNDESAAAYFATLGLDSQIARTLFLLLDVNDTNSVSIDEFVGGCMRLKGTARSIDVNMLLYENEKMIVKIVDSIEKLGQRIAFLNRSLGVTDPWEKEDNLKKLQTDVGSLRPCAMLAGLYTDQGSTYDSSSESDYSP